MRFIEDGITSVKDLKKKIDKGEYEVNDKVLITPCSHYYHNECINGWFKKSNKCPVCKFRIEKEIIQTKVLQDNACI